jgi:hypothetical protein
MEEGVGREYRNLSLYLHGWEISNFKKERVELIVEFNNKLISKEENARGLGIPKGWDPFISSNLKHVSEGDFLKLKET